MYWAFALCDYEPMLEASLSSNKHHKISIFSSNQVDNPNLVCLFFPPLLNIGQVFHLNFRRMENVLRKIDTSLVIESRQDEVH